MNNISFKYIFSFIILVIIVSACIPSKPTRLEKTLPSDRLIKKLEGNRRKIKTFNGNGIIQVETPKLSANANFEVILKKPDSIRISIYGPFGIDLAHGLVTRDDFLFYDVMKKTIYRGRSNLAIIQKIFKVNLSFNDLMDAFAGAVNLTEKLRRIPDEYDTDEDSFNLTYFNYKNKTKSLYIVNKEDYAITNYIISNLENDIILEGSYHDFRLFDEVPVPYLTNINYKTENQKLDIEYRNLEVNKKDLKINFIIPKDVKIVEW
ncbi:DUF4292 domain-containing protein [Bacteroidota bacterium]